MSGAAQQVAEIQSLFRQGQTASAMNGARKLVDQGIVDWSVLDSAWEVAIAQSDTAFMAQVLASIKRQAPRLRHWRLSLLQSSLFGVQHAWHEKIDALKRARKQGCTSEHLTVLEADAYERLFQPDKALALLQEQSFSGNLGDLASLVRARCLQQQKQDDALLELLQTWLPAAGNNLAAAAGHKLLARLYDKRKHFDLAWQEVAAGNAVSEGLRNEVLSDNSTRWRVEVWRELYKPGSSFSLPTIPYQGITPTFLIGFPRSGTTLMEQVLDAHPDIQAMEEPATVSMALALAYELARGRDWLANRGKPETRSKRQQLVSIFSQMANFSAAEIGRLRDAYFAGVEATGIEISSHPVLLDKMPLNTIDIAFIRMLFPEARFIVAIRHPADVLLSCLMQWFDNNDGMANFYTPDSGATFYKQVMGLLSYYEDAQSLSSYTHVIRYEDLVDDFDQQVSQLMEFMQLDKAERQSVFYKHARQRGTLATPSYESVTQPIYRGAMNRWQLYANQLAPVLEHLQPACTRYGYSLKPET